MASPKMWLFRNSDTTGELQIGAILKPPGGSVAQRLISASAPVVFDQAKRQYAAD
jgi:hypothetical protein